MRDDATPLFVQIAEQLSNDIIAGTYPEDTAVPSTNELAQFLRINPATAAKGLGILVDEGVLYKKRGIGMFVAPGARATLIDARRRAFATEYIVPLLREARALGITPAQLRALIEEASP